MKERMRSILDRIGQLGFWDKTLFSMRYLYIFLMVFGMILVIVMPMFVVVYMPLAYIWGRQDNGLWWRRTLDADHKAKKEDLGKLFARIEQIIGLMERLPTGPTVDLETVDKDHLDKVAKAHLN